MKFISDTINTNIPNTTSHDIKIMAIGSELYIITRKGLFPDPSKVDVQFARYGRFTSHYRNIDGGETSINRTFHGWRVPNKSKDAGLDRTWELKKITDDFLGNTGQEGLSVTNDLYCIRDDKDEGVMDVFAAEDSNDMQLYNRKCGFKLFIDNMPITDYMPFMARKVENKKLGNIHMA